MDDRPTIDGLHVGAAAADAAAALLEAARRAGVDAAILNEPLTSCPHRPGSDEHNAWTQGWVNRMQRQAIDAGTHGTTGEGRAEVGLPAGSALICGNFDSDDVHPLWKDDGIVSYGTFPSGHGGLIAGRTMDDPAGELDGARARAVAVIVARAAAMLGVDVEDVYRQAEDTHRAMRRGGMQRFAIADAREATDDDDLRDYLGLLLR